MKITLVINSITSGGAERALTILANCWAEQGHEITLLTFDGGEEPPFYPLDGRIHHISLGIGTTSASLPAKLLQLPRTLYQLRKAILLTKPDAVLSYMDQANIISLLATLGANLKITICEQVHPALSSIKEKRYPFLLRLAFSMARAITYPLASAIIVLSEHSRRCFSKALQHKIHVVSNPIIVPPIELESFTLHRPAIVGLGRLTYQKNFESLITAFAPLASSFSEWSLYIFGEGEEREQLTSLARQLGVSDRVSLPGRTETPYHILSQTDIFVLPSRYEGFPLALGEAMASGCSVIATDCPTGPGEMIVDGVNGLLTPVENAEALTEALRTLMSNPLIRIKLGANARKITDTFGVNQVSSTMLRILAGHAHE